jgi:hypothetical protein
VVPSTITVSSGGAFTGYAFGGVPFSSFTVTYTNRNTGATVLTGSASLDGSGNYSAPGNWTITGNYRLTVYFGATGNTRSADFTAI